MQDLLFPEANYVYLHGMYKTGSIITKELLVFSMPIAYYKLIQADGQHANIHNVIHNFLFHLFLFIGTTQTLVHSGE